MPYQYRSFEVDGISANLPIYNSQQDHSPMPGESPFVRTADGFYAPDEDALAVTQTHTLTGEYWGVDEYITDENGAYLTDENGAYILGADGPTSLRSQVQALRAKHRKWGTLWRVRLEWGVFSGEVRQWKRAQLSMAQPQDVSDKLFKARIPCSFETGMTHWHAETATTHTATATVSGATTQLLVESTSEATIEDAVLTITALDVTITIINVVCAELGIDFTWTGSLTTNNSLVINPADLAIEDDATDAYSGFVRNAGHTAETWLPLTQGLHNFLITITGGDATITLTHYEQEP